QLSPISCLQILAPFCAPSIYKYGNLSQLVLHHLKLNQIISLFENRPFRIFSFIMAHQDSNAEPEMSVEEEQRLKYLEFVQVATLHAVLCLSKLYAIAKDKSGPLKPGVETVEETVKSVVGPVYDKFHGVPIDVLKFVDRKVDESVTELDRKVPPSLKQVSAQAFSAAQMAPVAARAVASEVQSAGVVNTASGIAKSVYTKYEPAAKELYFKYEPKAEQCAVSAWRKLNQLPLFPQVAQVVLPTAAYCTEKYNQTVVSIAEKGYRVSSYLPLVPTEKIVKAFRDDKPESQMLVLS
ncbi:REF domain-containing protein, partial [Cephalotus follicularis]